MGMVPKANSPSCKTNSPSVSEAALASPPTSQQKEKLRTWEVNFAYKEDGEKKNALVKLRLCPDCSYKLNYHHKRKEVTKKKKRRKSEKKRKRKSGTEGSDKRSKRHKQVCALVRKLPSSINFPGQFFSRATMKNRNYP